MKPKSTFLFLVLLWISTIGALAQTTITVGPSGTYPTIQAAIDAASAGDVIEVAAGTYVEWVTVNKQLELRGPNWNIPGNGSRVAEAIIKFPAEMAGSTSGSLLDIGVYNSTSDAADGSIIKGFLLDGSDYNTGYSTTGINSYQSGVVIQNNIVKNFNRMGIYVSSYWWTGSAWNYNNYHNGIDISNNLITSSDIFNTYTTAATYGFGIYLQGTIGNVTDNVVEYSKCGIQVQPYSHPNTSATIGIVANNVFNAYRRGMYFNYSENSNANWQFNNNTVNGIAPPATDPTTYYYALTTETFLAGQVSFSGNIVNIGSASAPEIFMYKKIGNPGGTIDLDATFANNTWERCAVIGNGTNITGPIFYSNIQSAITAATAGNVINVAAGTYAGNITVNKNISLIGTSGAANTVLDGNSAGSELGTIQVTSGLNGVLIQGFTIKGINGNGGLEKAAIYLTGAQTNISIKDNIVEARGDAGLMGEYNAVNNAIVIDNNEFTGQTYTGSNPSGVGFATQFNVGNNCPRQLVVFGGGPGTTNTQNFTFTNNTISGISGGMSITNDAGGTISPTAQGNTMVTLDLAGTNTITGNDFSGTTTRYAEALRTRGPGVYTVTGNSFTGSYPLCMTRSITPDNYVSATCNWWGTSVPSEVAAKVVGKITYVPYNVSAVGPCEGGLPVVVTHADASTNGYAAIQGAINAASTVAGDVITVAPGTYNELITINKGVSLVSTGGRDVTFISAPFGTLTNAVKITATNLGTVTIDGFTVKDFTEGGIIQPMSMSTGTAFKVYNCKVIPYSSYLRNGIQVSGNGSEVIGNYVVGASLTADWAGTGITVVNASNVLVQGNTVNTGHPDNGIAVMNYSVALVDNITIHENTVIGANYSGISIQGADATSFKEISNVTITANVFKDGASDGIDVWYCKLTNLTVTGNEIFNNTYDGLWFYNVGTVLTGAIDIHNNKIYNNYQYGINNTNTYTVDATCNWYGTADYNLIPTKVSANVNYMPYLVTDDIVSPVCTGNVWPVHNVTQSLYYQTIQSAITAANINDVIEVAAGTYPENVIVDKRLTIQGAGESTIISGTGGVVLQLAAGTDAVNRMIVKNLKVTGGTTGLTAGSYTTLENVLSESNTSYGINLNPLTDLVITNCSFNLNGLGLKLASTASASNITITGSHFDNNTQHGWYSDASSAVEPDLDNVSITNTTFSGNAMKGFYTERLSNATFDNVTIENSGSTAYDWGAGIDINLKWKAYSNITIQNSAITNCGIGALNGVGATIKARDDASSYNSNPATLTNVTIDNVTFTGNKNGLNFGEPGKDNNSPTAVLIKNSTFSNVVMDINNYSKANIDALTNNTFASTADNFVIEDRIYHKLDNAVKGLVTWVADNVYVTTNSGSIQRGFDASATGGTVNISSGNFTLPSALNLNKAITIKGNNFGIPAATGIGTIPSGRQPESIITTVSDDIAIMINAGNIVLDGLHIRGPQRMIRNYVAADNVFIMNCLVENTTYGNEMIQCYGSGSRVSWKFENNRFSGNYSNGSILFANEFTNTLVEENDFMGYGNRHLFGAPTNLTIRGNYFSANSNTLINMNGLNNPLIENNIAYVNGFGFQLTTIGGGIVQNNTFIGVQAYNSGGINYLRGIDVFGTAFSGPNSNGLVIQNNTFQNFTSGTINPTDQYRGIHIRQGATGITIHGNKFINSHTALGIVSATPAVSAIDMYENDLSGIQIGVNNGSAQTVSADLNYWGGCPSYAGAVGVFPYYTTISGTPGSFSFGGSISNIDAQATVSTICEGSSATVYATGGSDYLWDNGLGLGSSKVVSPVVNTTYNVTGKDANGCPGAFDGYTLAVTPAPVVLINGSANGTSTIPAAQQVVLTASGATDYLWNTDEDTPSINVYPTATTTYSVTGTTGLCSASATHTITPIIISAGPNQFICNGSSTSLTATVTGAVPTAYLWTPGGETTQSITVNPSSTQAYNVTVTVGGSNPSAGVTVFVNSKPVANAGPDITIAPLGSGTLTGIGSSGTAPYTYLWNTGATTKSLPVNAAGTYNLVVTDAFGCISNPDYATVTVASTGYTVSGNISYNNTLNPQMHNVTVTLKQGGVTKYTAVTPASGFGNYTILGVDNGTYDVSFSLTTAWGGVTSADIVAIQNHYKPVGAVPLIGLKRLAADVYLNSTSALVDVNDRTAVNNKRLYPNNPAYNFATGNWVFVKEENVLTNTVPYTFANAAGTSNIQITVLDGAVTQNFKSLCYGDVDASYSGYKILEVEGTIVDVDAVDGLSFKNYPNPFNHNTTLSYAMPVEGNVTIDIYNLTGSRVARIENGNQAEGEYTCNWDARNMPNGLYIAMIVVKTSDDVLRQQVKMILNK